MPDSFDYEIVSEFSICVLNFVLDADPSTVVDDTLNFLFKMRLKKGSINAIEKNKSVSVLGRIDLEIKKTCIDVIETRLSEKQDPLSGYATENFEQYKNILRGCLNIAFDTDQIPWLFDHIIESVNLQCSEFVFVTLYNNKLTNRFNASEARYRKFYSQLQSLKDDAINAQEHVDEAIASINDVFETINENNNQLIENVKNAETAAQNANKAAEASNQAATEASKKITETSVTVLGMFSGIVITIVAGLFYSSSVLDNINAANFYRLISTAAVVGFVCYHLVALMFRCIDKFRDPNTALIKKDRVSLWVSIVLGVLFAGGIALQFIFPSECKHELPDEWSIEQEATCTEVGSKYKQCQVCEKIVERETISLLEHVYVSFTIQTASCTEEGVSFQKCVDCGVCETPVIIPAIGHNYEEVIMIPATATEAGEKRLWCATCNALTEPIVIPPYGE